MYPLFISGPYESLENDSLNLIPVHIAEGLLLKKILSPRQYPE